MDIRRIIGEKRYKLLRYGAGYILFFIAIGYGIWQAPHEIWLLQPFWLGLTVVFILMILPLELAQFFIFLAHQKKSWQNDLFIPIRITTRKSTLNAIFPAQTGTLLFLYMVTTIYQVKWHEYIRFTISAALLMLVVSVLGALSLFLPFKSFLMATASILGIAWIASICVKKSYFRNSLLLLLTGGGIYVCRLLIFWSILQALNSAVSFREAGCFAIVANTLAQIPLTPGNIGIREIVFGILAPHLALPMSIGVLIGGIFQILRLTIYALIMLLSDFIHVRYFQGSSQILTNQPATDHIIPSHCISK